MYGGKIYETFYDFLYNKQLNDKIKSEFGKNIKKLKSQNIKKDILNNLSVILSKYIEMDEVLKNGDKLYQVLSYCQENINTLKILKESNIEDFKKILLSQINYLYKNKQEDLIININELITLLDNFFNYDFDNKKKNLKEIDEFTKKIIEIKVKSKELFINSEKKIKEIIKQHKKAIVLLLEEKKNENDLNHGVVNMDKINNELTIKFKEFNDVLQSIFNNINSEYAELYKEFEKTINDFSEGKIHIKNLPNFNDYLLSVIGDKNKSLEEQLYKDIKFNLSLYDIYNKKGLIEMIKSALSEYHFLFNNIEIISNNIIRKSREIIRILNDYLIKYNQKLLHLIDLSFNLASIKFTEEQLIIFKEIKEYYNNIKIKLLEIKLNLYSNSI